MEFLIRQVNVFELGHTYLQLVQTLNMRLPLVDPSHYISRFAALLEFGDETPKVATDAVRLVQRFDRDWMTKGRRPAGICGASLLLAARMNNFRRSIQEIVQVVKIADTTVKQRLNEFKKTPSGTLTLADFRTVWLEDEMDPPAFTKGKEKEAQEAAGGSSEDGVEEQGVGKKGRKKKRKKGRRAEEAGEEIEGAYMTTAVLETLPQPGVVIDPRLLQQRSFTDLIRPSPLFLPDDEDLTQVALTNQNIDPTLLAEDLASQPTGSPPCSEDITQVLLKDIPSPSYFEQQADMAIADEVNDFLTNVQGSTLSEALDDAEERRQAQLIVVDELLGLDEEELDDFILTEDEVRIKERVWVELNKDYLEAIASECSDTIHMHCSMTTTRTVRDAQRSEAEVAGKSKKVSIQLDWSKPLSFLYSETSSSPFSFSPASEVKCEAKRLVDAAW